MRKRWISPWPVIFLLLAGVIPSMAQAPAVPPAESLAAAGADTTKPPMVIPQPPSNVQLVDIENDAGNQIDILWEPSPDDSLGHVSGYRILRAEAAGGPFIRLANAAPGKGQYRDVRNMEMTDSKPDPNALIRGKNYWYKVLALAADESTYTESAVAGPVKATQSWFHTGRTIVVIGTIIFCGLIILFIKLAQKGKEFYVRPIAGLSQLDEAVGRATELGRPILHVMGIGGYSAASTLASYTILGRVVKMAGQYQTRVIVPCFDIIAASIAKEVVKDGYTQSGRPDLYRPDDVYFVTDQQFPYAAAVNGIMLREKTATNLYLGTFRAESLLLAETGAIAGSIQIAGTDSVEQIPFFIVSCDYTLIGEELYAASAYLSREPLQLGSLKGQDWGKGVIMVLLLVGAIFASFHSQWLFRLLDVPLE